MNEISIICELIDQIFYDWEIDRIMEEACLLIPAMKRQERQAPLYHQNIAIVLPEVAFSEERGMIIAMFFNYMAYED